MTEAEAKAVLDARVKAGGRLVVAQQADLRAVKLLLERCHAAGVPALLGPAPGGG